MFDLLSHYRTATAITDFHRHFEYLDGLSDEPEALILQVQNLLVHYQTDKQKLSPEVLQSRRDEVDTRWLSVLLDHARRLGPLEAPREPNARVLTTCRDFAVLLCGLMRYKQIPSRVRYGFAHDQYISSRPMHDHVLVEYFHDGRWKFAESRLHLLPQPMLDIPQSDIPQDFFFTGGEVWRQIRSGERNERAFSGYRFDKDYGQWTVRNLFLFDLASLCGYEPLMWDAWGSMLEEKPGARITHARQLALLDRWAGLDPRDPRDCHTLIREFCSTQGLCVEQTVHSFSPVRGAYQVRVQQEQRA